MNQSIELQIQECEQRLKQAMLQSDVTALDELLAPELSFTNHLGQLMTKQNDFEAHRSGILEIHRIELTDQRITVYDTVAIVTVIAFIAGEFAGETSENHFRFTRVWSKSSNDRWRVIAGHSSIAA